MGVILNELSFHGQFADRNEFSSGIVDFIMILDAFAEFRIEVWKKYNFFDCDITPTQKLGEILYQRFDDANQLLMSALSRLLGDPYWETDTLHSCDDEYVIAQTTDKCGYGLAEAFERESKVISADSSFFRANTISFEKNKMQIEVANIYNTETLKLLLLELINEGILEQRNNFHKYIPLANLVVSLNMDDVNGYLANRPPGEKIATYKQWGKEVALLNFWALEQNMSRRHINDRDIYTKEIDGRVHYLSIDTENGGFEIFDHGGRHRGEFNFIGEPNRPLPQKHFLKFS